MSVSTLLNTKWTISTSIQIPQGGVSQEPLDVKFCSNGKIFESILITDDPADKIIYGNTTVYDNGSWVDSNYRTISIYGGTDVIDAYLIDFLETYAAQISTDTKLVDGTILDDNLGAVATAIRAKTGGSTTIAFPAGFVSSIASINGGGGSGGIDGFTVDATFHTFRGIILLFITDGAAGAYHTFSITISHSNESKTITFDNGSANHYICIVGDGTNAVGGNITINVTSNYTDSDLKPTYSYVNVYYSNYYVREAHGTAQPSASDGTGSVNIPYNIGNESYYNYILINGAMDTTEG